MKQLILTLVLLLVALPVNAQGTDTGNNVEAWLKPVEAKYVCMVNNAKFEREQIAVEVDGKTYYGCCPMCKSMLQNDAAKRTGTDPVSGNHVDKAEAVIGADPEGKVHYFENQKNFDQYMEEAPKEREALEGVGHDNAVYEQGHELHNH